MSPDMVQVGRLAFRREGAVVNAYFAKNETMSGAILLGTINVAVCDEEPTLFERFKVLMRDAYSGVVFRTTGVEPTWGGEHQAPEHERAGRA